MSADDKEAYFDGPHMSTANQQPPCSSVVDQRQQGPLLYNTVTSSQVHNHISNPLSGPFFYNPNQVNSMPSSWEAGPSGMQENQLIPPKTNGETQQENHVEQSSSSASSSQHNSPSKSNYYSNMPQGEQVNEFGVMESVDLSAGPSTSDPALAVPDFESDPMGETQYNALPGNFLPVDHLQPGQYMSPQQVVPEMDPAYQQLADLSVPMPHMENAQWGDIPPNQSFGSYMNMANTANQDQMSSLIQQQQLYEPVLLHEAEFVAEESNQLSVADSIEVSDAAISRQANFSSDHLHHGYPSSSRREFEDILHSQGTWPMHPHNGSMPTYPQADANFDREQGADVANATEDNDDNQPRVLEEQPTDDLNNLESDSHQIASVNNAAVQMQALNICEEEEIALSDNLSEDDNGDHASVEELKSLDDGDVDLRLVSQRQLNQQPVVVAEESPGPSASDNRIMEAELPQPVTEESREINLHPPCAADPEVTVAQIFSSNTTQAFVRATGDATGVEPFPTTSHVPPPPPLTVPRTRSFESSVISEAQPNAAQILSEETMQPLKPPMERPIIERHTRNHSISSSSSHRSAASQQSSTKPPAHDPQPLAASSSFGGSDVVNTPALPLEANMMHSSYVSVQSQDPVQVFNPSVTSGQPSLQPPSLVPTPSAATASAPQSLHSQMVVGKVPISQMPHATPLAVASQQQSYNDMHASATHRPHITGGNDYGNQVSLPAQSAQAPPTIEQRSYSSGNVHGQLQNERSATRRSDIQIEHHAPPIPQMPPQVTNPQPNVNQNNLRSDVPQRSGYERSLNETFPQSYQHRGNESYDRPPRPHSRSSATAAEPYYGYQDNRPEYSDSYYGRPHSRQGYATDRGYSRSRQAPEQDDYYTRRRRKDDDYYYYNRREYDYQGYGQYYQRPYYEDGGYQRDDYYRAQDGNYYRSSDYYSRRQYDSYSSYRGDPYYQDNHHQQYRPRQNEEDDQRSMYSERSMHYNDPERRPQQQQEQPADMYNESYQAGYNSMYYGQNLNESTYTNTYNEEAWEELPQVAARRTPAKFSSAHPIARFGAGGHLIHVLPHLPKENQPAVVEIHKVETLLQNTPEAEEFRAFPGPLSKEVTHKNDVLRFASLQASRCLRSTELMDRTSAALIWEFLGLLVRQNGSILGTDVAELLMKDHSGDFGLLESPNDSQKRRNSSPQHSGDELNPDASEMTLTGETSQSSGSTSSFRFRELLLYGRKKDALEWAMKSNLWGHALLLASKTDARTHANVMLRFANSLPINDPLQTLYQQMSGRQPASATCIAEEGWGDWRPHLAMILSNATNNVTHDTKIAMTMGDTLIAKGLLDAAHFCYLMASAPLGYYKKKTNKLVLLGANQNLPFDAFALNEAICRSETYEYAISLGSQSRHKVALLPPLQIFKFIYACRLMECGMVAEAFHYCELIAKLICRSPKSYSITLVTQLSHIVDLLQNHDPRLQAGNLLAADLQWIDMLHKISDQMIAGGMVSVTSYTPSESTSSDERISSTRTSPLDQLESPRSEEVQDGWAAGGMVDSTTNMYMQPQHQHHQHHQAPQETYGNVGGQPAYDNNSQQAQTPTFYQNQPQDQIQISHGILQDTNPLQQPPTTIPTYDTSNNNNQQYQQQQQTNPVPLYDPSSQPYQQPAHQQTGFYDQSNQPVQYQPEVQENSQYSQSQNQHETVTDYYDQFSGVRAVNRIRTTSQASHASHHSRASSQRQRLDSKRSRSSGQRSRTVSENSQRSRSRSTSAESEKRAKTKEPEKESKGWFFGLWGGKKKTNSHKVHLPDDKNKEIVWDNEQKRWINMNEPEEERAPLAPPPMDNSATPQVQTAPQPSGSAQTDGGPPSALTPNKFSLKNMSGRPMYKNAFSSSTTSQNGALAPPEIFPTMQPAASAMFVPKAVPTSAPQDEPVTHPQHQQPDPVPGQETNQYVQHQQQQTTNSQQQPSANMHQPQHQQPHQPEMNQPPLMTQQNHQPPPMSQQNNQPPPMSQPNHQQPMAHQQHQQPVMTQQPPAFQHPPATNFSQSNDDSTGLTSASGGGAFVPVVPRSSQNQTPTQEPSQPVAQPQTAPPAMFFNPANFTQGNVFSQPPAPASSRGGGLSASRGRGRGRSYPAAR